MRICKTTLIWPSIHPFAASYEHSNEHQVPLKWGDIYQLSGLLASQE